MNNSNRISILAALLVVLLVACGGKSAQRENEASAGSGTTQKQEVVMAKIYDYRVVASYPHSTRSYTQGLQYVDGTMWEGTGQYGRSQLQSVDLATGKVKCLASLPDNEFGEGITLYKGNIYQLTWSGAVAGINYAEDVVAEPLEFKPVYVEMVRVTNSDRYFYFYDRYENELVLNYYNGKIIMPYINYEGSKIEAACKISPKLISTPTTLRSSIRIMASVRRMASTPIMFAL